MDFEILGKILLAVIALFTILNFILNIWILQKVRFNEFRMNFQMNQDTQSGGVVFCKKCNHEYSSALRKCPVCGEVRK